MSSKLFGAGIVAAAILASPLAAQAADLRTPSYKAPAYVSPAYASWSGFYVGIVGTYGFGKSSWSNAVATTGDFDVKGPMAVAPSAIISRPALGPGVSKAIFPRAG
jgi:opacity protein-like surface antigen